MTSEEANTRIDAGELKGWVYLIEDPALGAIKVGWSKDPERRLSALQTSHAGELTLLAVIPGTKRLELDIHRKLIFARRYGEWFEAAAAMRLLRPVIRDFGLKLIARAAESRNSPERRRYGAREKLEFVIEVEELA